MGYDERIELGDTGLTMEDGTLKDRNGKPAQKPCPVCGQVDKGQTGEYPCPSCGLPYVWDNDPNEGSTDEEWDH